MLGRVIENPLKNKVDEIIEDELGTDLKRGMRISIRKFDSIRNTLYVRRRLEQKGFGLLRKSVCIYVYQYGEQTVGSTKFGKPDVLNRLKRDGFICNEEFSTEERTKLSNTIAALKRNDGYDFEYIKSKSKLTGFYITTYKLKTSNSGELSEAC